jgi:hypothetical protein
MEGESRNESEGNFWALKSGTGGRDRDDNEDVDKKQRR